MLKDLWDLCFLEKQKSFDIHIREFSYCVKTCYYISTEKKTWFESKKVCQDQGADLLKIDDREEQVWLFINIEQFVCIE